MTYKSMGDPWLHEQYISHSDHNVTDDLGNLMLQVIPNVDFLNAQTAPTVCENAYKFFVNDYFNNKNK